MIEFLIGKSEEDSPIKDKDRNKLGKKLKKQKKQKKNLHNKRKDIKFSIVKKETWYSEYVECCGY